MTDEKWRPLGIDADDEIAEYDALHDGVPTWMSAAFWAWIKDTLTERRRYRDGSGSVDHLREEDTEKLAQSLKIPLPNVRFKGTEHTGGSRQLAVAMKTLQEHGEWLRIADYMLAHFASADADTLDALLERSKSAWRVGTRAGKPGLVRRVPIGVQLGADTVMGRAGHAGVRLAGAWEALYSPASNPSEAYRLAILAVEDASVPVVSPTNQSATLGTVLKQMEDQANWNLPMTREHPNAPSSEVLVSMMRILWHGQHDRHGGQPSAPGNVSQEEAIVAVGLATTLVQWFDAGIVARATN